MNTKLLLTLAILSAGSNAPKIQASATVLCGPAVNLKNVSGDFNAIAHLFIASTSDGQSCVIRYNSLPACPSAIPATGVTSACKAAAGIRAVGSQPYLDGKATVVLPAGPNAIMQNQTGYSAAQVTAAFTTGAIPSAPGVRAAAAVASNPGIVTTISNTLKAMGTLP